MAQVAFTVAMLAFILGIVAAMLPTLSFNLGGWLQAVSIINYGFLFVEPLVFVTCFGVVIGLQQAELLYAIANWLIKVLTQ